MTPSGSHRLYKREKLCSRTAVESLFDRSGGSEATTTYPLRVVWRDVAERKGGAQFLVTVPKKRLRHAVDRVTVRRRIREAYRLSRHLLGDYAGRPVDIAFIYLGDKVISSAAIHSAMHKALGRIASSPTVPRP